MDRRQSPRIKFAKNIPGFVIKLIVKRFFFKDKEILCTLRDISEGGASLQVTNEYKKFISESDAGKKVQLISESKELSFKLKRRGKILRVFDKDHDITIVVIFSF